MSQRTWRAFSAAEKHQMWLRWRAGEPIGQIGEALQRRNSSINAAIAAQGGFSPLSRSRCARALSLAEREEISRGLCSGSSLRQIAHHMGRSPSTVSREIARHGGREAYRAASADERAWKLALRPKPCHLALHAQLRESVAGKLQALWSPQQIARWLERSYGDDQSMRVSHETIYKSLFIQARGALKKQLMTHLRSGRTLRRSVHAAPQGHTKSQIREALTIRERPAEADDRAVPGHWEGDLLCGGNRSQIATLVERHSRYVMLVKIPSKDTETVVSALSKHMRTLPGHLRRSLTWDRGWEMAAHKDFTLATDMKVYLCDPHSPWQRGSNENTNRLLRQYFPKGKDLSGYSQVQLNRVALSMNQRPRETLGWDAPADKLNATVASTG
jgi:IS30 family transposase